MAKAKEVPGTAVAAPAEAPPSALADFSAEEIAELQRDAQTFDKGMTSKDVAIPFLKVIQALSPELKKADARYNPDAEEGDLVNSATQQLWPGSDGVFVIPVHFARSYTEWKPERGGFVADYGADASLLSVCKKDAKGKFILPNGNVFQEAMLYYLFIVDPDSGAVSEAVLSLTSTQMKHARKWNTTMRTRLERLPNGQTFNPATFFYTYRLTTQVERKGENSWYGVKIEPYCPTQKLPFGREIYSKAKELYQSVKAGLIRAGVPMEEEPVVESEAAEPAHAPAAGEADFEFPE